MQEPSPLISSEPGPESDSAQPLQPVAPPTPPPRALWSVLVLVAFALGLGAGYLIWASPQQARTLAAEQRAQALETQLAEAQQNLSAAQAANAAAPAGGDSAAEVEAPQQVQRYPVPVDDDYGFGSESAPITIIEFSDYECPYCRRWHQQVWPQIQARYGEQVRLVYRDFPLESIHPNATPAAEAANCAGEQGRYEEYNELLFTGERALGPDTYTAYAEQLGLKLDDFQTCVQERRYQEEVQADLAYASQLGVRSTPTFFINGLAVVGAQPFEVFQQIIDLELAGKIPQ